MCSDLMFLEMYISDVHCVNGEVSIHFKSCWGIASFFFPSSNKLREIFLHAANSENKFVSC